MTGWRAIFSACGAAVLLLATPAATMAHGDVHVAGRSVAVEPGGAVRFPASLHYHRLVAAVTADGPVMAEFVEAAEGRTVIKAGPATAIRINELVRCCDTAWAEHELVITNPGTTTVMARVDARLIHDDLAVMVDGAEDGTRASIVVLGLLWAALVWRALRHRRRNTVLRDVLPPIAAAGTLIVAALAIGAVRYGGTGPGVILAGMGDFPVVPINPIVSRASLLTLVCIVLWGIAGLRWTRVGDPRSLAWYGTGLCLGAAVAAVAVAVSVEYHRGGVALATALAAFLPLLWVAGAARGASGEQRQG